MATSRSSIAGTSETCAPSGASSGSHRASNRSRTSTGEPASAPRRSTRSPPTCAGVKQHTHGSNADASSAVNDPATAAPTARRGSSTSFGSPPVPLVATTAHARSGSAVFAPPKSTSSSGVTSIVGDARAMRRRCSRSVRRTSTGRKDAPEAACAARMSSQIGPGGTRVGDQLARVGPPVRRHLHVG